MAHVPVEQDPTAAAAIVPAEPEPATAPPAEVSRSYDSSSLPLPLSFLQFPQRLHHSVVEVVYTGGSRRLSNVPEERRPYFIFIASFTSVKIERVGTYYVATSWRL